MSLGKTTRYLSIATIQIFVFVLAACSAESTQPITISLRDGGLDPSAIDGAISGSGGSIGNGGNGGSTDDDDDAGHDSFGKDGGRSSETCVGVEVDPTPITTEVTEEVKEIVETTQPIAIYIMLDKSGSMDDEVRTNVTRWDMAVDSINTFVRDTESEDIKVALQYFPIDDSDCDGSGFYTPAVDMGALSDIADDIEASLDENGPEGTTPVEGALRGLTNYCIDYQEDNPDEKCVGVLVTDGAPRNDNIYDCTVDNDEIANIAADAYNNHDVKTFTVGMEDEGFDLLEQIAQESLSDCYPDTPPDYSACDIRADANLLEALEAIRETVTVVTSREVIHEVIHTMIQECEWGIPDPPEDQTFDRELVNVTFSAPGELDRIIGKVSDESQCERLPDGWGWYYDDNDEPGKIIVCPETCTIITSTESGRIDIQLGCETVEALI